MDNDLLDLASTSEKPADDIDVWMRQFVNRWVFLPHQREVALTELRELIAEVRRAS